MTAVPLPVPPAQRPAAEVAAALAANLDAVLLGKPDAVRLVVAAVLSGGHVLLEDSPGVGKTLLAKALARSVGAEAGRLQGTSDLLPSDVTGSSTWDPASGEWVFRPGPVFHHVVLVDEVNRATPRAQSALLEAMAEGHVTIDGAAHPLPVPFTVIATQNPFGDPGTFPLIEGQADRFAVVVSLGLPDRTAERRLLLGEGGVDSLERLSAAVDPAGLHAAQVEVAQLYVHEPLVDYVLDVVAATRLRLDLPRGASTRASQALLAVARGHAASCGRTFVAPDDVKAVAAPVLAHRLATVARRETAWGAEVVAELLAQLPVPTP